MARKLNAEEIVNVVEALIGDFEPIGDTYHDDLRYDRLEVLIEVTDRCIGAIDYAAQYHDRPEASMAKIGKEAARYMSTKQRELTNLCADLML